MPGFLQEYAALTIASIAESEHALSIRLDNAESVHRACPLSAGTGNSHRQDDNNAACNQLLTEPELTAYGKAYYGASVEVHPLGAAGAGKASRENFGDAINGVIQLFREVLAKNGWYWGTTLVLLHSGHRAVFFSCSLMDIVRVKLLSHFLQRYS